MDSLLPWVPSVISLVVAVLAFRKSGVERAKIQAEAQHEEAETAKLIQEAAGGLLREYQAQVEKLEEKVERLLGRVRVLEDELGCVENEKAELEMALESQEEAAGRWRKMYEGVLSGAWVLFHQVFQLGHEPQYEPPEQRRRV